MNTARFDNSLTSLLIACRHTLIAIDLALIGEPLPEEQGEDTGTVKSWMLLAGHIMLPN